MINISGIKGYTHEETIPAGEEGEAVVVKPIANASGNVGVMMVPGSNTGKVQYTFSSMEKIEAGTANWVDWSDGEVTANAGTAFVAPVTAVRGVSVSGEVALEVAV